MPDWWWQFECSHIPTSTNLGSLDFLEQGAQQAYKKHNGGNGIARGVQVMSKWRGYACTQCHDNYLTELLFCRAVLHYVLHITHNYMTNQKHITSVTWLNPLWVKWEMQKSGPIYANTENQCAIVPVKTASARMSYTLSSCTLQCNSQNKHFIIEKKHQQYQFLNNIYTQGNRG